MAISVNAQQQTAGIKIAQLGFNAITCPDYDLIFNSSWPSLAIVFDQNFSITYDSFGSPTPTTITHNLGFYSLTMAWQFTDSTQTVSMGRIFPNIGQNQVYMPTSLAFSTTIYLNIKCYNLDITVPQSYNYIQPAAVNSVYDPTYGIKVSKQNAPINSTDMRNFILHSRCASPQVLAVITDEINYNSVTGTGNNNGTLQYQNPQNYTPWVFGYGASMNSGNVIYIWAAPNAQAYPTLSFGTIKGSNSLILAGNPVKGSIIALRDPLFAPNTIQAIY